MLEIKHLYKNYLDFPVLSDISLHIGEHEIVAIAGPSGCGKSTLLNIIASITKEYSGTITTQAGRIGYVFQEDRILPWLNVYENVAVVRKKQDRDRIREILENEKVSVLSVTHDVDEALSIANRIVVFSRRPGRILEEITLPGTQKLRNVLSEENLKIKHRIMDRLSME